MTPFDRISAFVLERLPELPLQVRARLYRDLAELTSDEGRAGAFVQLARDLDAIEARHRQLELDFRTSRLGGAR